MPSTTTTQRQPRLHMNSTAAELAILDDLIRQGPRSTTRAIAAAAAAFGVEVHVDTLSRRRRSVGYPAPTATERAVERQRALDDLIRVRLNFGPEELLALATAAGIVTTYKNVLKRRALLGGPPILLGQTRAEHAPPEPTAVRDEAIKAAAALERREGTAALLNDQIRLLVGGNVVARMLIDWRAGGLGVPAKVTRRYCGPDLRAISIVDVVRPYIEEWRSLKAKRRRHVAERGAR